MFGWRASEAFSRAMLSALFGMSCEKIVKAQPDDTKVPEVSVSRWNSTLAQEPASAARHASASAGMRGERAGRSAMAGDDSPAGDAAPAAELLAPKAVVR